MTWEDFVLDHPAVIFGAELFFFWCFMVWVFTFLILERPLSPGDWIKIAGMPFILLVMMAAIVLYSPIVLWISLKHTHWDKGPLE